VPGRAKRSGGGVLVLERAVKLGNRTDLPIFGLLLFSLVRPIFLATQDSAAMGRR